ncbi:MAG TPA: ATP-binding protein, partial [Polyangiaceae bacterium]
MHSNATADDARDLTELIKELHRQRELIEQLRVENEYLLESQRVLEQTRDYYADLYDFAPLASFTLDHAGNIRSLNLQATRLFAHDRRQILGMPLRRFVMSNDRSLLQDHLLSCSAGLASCELRVTTGGDEQPNLVRLISRQVLESGSPSYVCAAIDLRERVRAEEESRQLAKGARDLQAANDAKDQFIAVLSHELRTPLTPVLAAISALSEKEDTPADLRATFAMLQRNVNAEARLIDDLLDVTRIAHGKLSIEKRPMDVHRAVHDTVETLHAEIQAKELDIEYELDADERWVAGDSARLRQVFWNIVRNAIKFSDKRQKITIRSWNRDGHIALEVSDMGCGIAAGDVPRLFAPFSQLIDDSSSPRGGLGLGLTICRGIMDLHGGQISAHSRGPHQGARFVVDLTTVEEPAQLTPDRRSTPPPPKRLRILLVEDHADTVDVLRDLLSRAGYETCTATSVEEALEYDLGSV